MDPVLCRTWLAWHRRTWPLSRRNRTILDLTCQWFPLEAIYYLGWNYVHIPNFQLPNSFSCFLIITIHLDFLLPLHSLSLIPGCPSCNSSNTGWRPGSGTNTREPHRIHPFKTDNSVWRLTNGSIPGSGELSGNPCWINWRICDNVASLLVQDAISFEEIGDSSRCSTRRTNSGVSSSSAGWKWSGKRLRASALPCSEV